MSTVHLIRCTAADEPARVGELVLALARRVIRDEGLVAEGPTALVADHPVRARVREQWEAWTSPLADWLGEEGWQPAVAPSPREPAPTAARLPVEGKRLDGLDVGEAVAGARSLVSLHRVSLHERSGMEGVLHGLATGCASADGLKALQTDVQPTVDRDVCGGCGMCVTLCGNEGIRHNGHVAVVKPETCLGCGDCLAECFLEALTFPDGASRRLMERCAEGAAAVAAPLRGRSLHVALALPEPVRRIAMQGHHVPQPEVGILAGTDPLAVDRAAAELIAASLGAPLAELTRCPEDPLHLLAHGAESGLGDGAHVMVDHDPAGLAC